MDCGHCEDCRWWHRGTEAEFAQTGKGECRQLNGKESKLVVEFYYDYAFDDLGWITTAPDFGCREFTKS